MGHLHGHPLTWAGMLVTLGIIFGDIGTSLGWTRTSP
jgi:K+ transporter